MQAVPKMSYLSTDEFSLTPRVDILSKINEDELKFTLSGVNASIANAIRRILLSDIPMVIFRTSPNDRNKCNITSNTCGLHNEIVKHRLSCIPIHIKDIDELQAKKYFINLNVENNTDTTIIVTTKDFVVYDSETNKPLPEDKTREIFPANDITGDFIDFVRLKSKPAEELQSKKIILSCEFDIGTAKEDGAFNAVATCAYGNTIDDVAQEAKLQQLKQKWKDDGKKEHEIEFEAINWKLLEGKRIFKKDSFDFVIQSVGVYTNVELLALSCKTMIQKLYNFDTIIEEDKLEIKLAETTMQNSFDIVLEHEDYTLGKVIEYFLLSIFYEKGLLTYCGFKMLHPHDHYCLIRVSYKSPVEISKIKGDIKVCVHSATDTFNKIRKEFLKLVPR
jgi:DNA-directed RNA polymerase subunit L